MQDFEAYSIQHGCFFEYQGCRTLGMLPQSQYPLLHPHFNRNACQNPMMYSEKSPIEQQNFAGFCESTNSPYLLEIIQEMHQVMIVNQKSLNVIPYSKLESVKNLTIKDSLFSEHLFDGGMNEDIFMTRLSECSYQLALVYPSKVCIVKPGIFMTEFFNYGQTLQSEAEFALSGDRKFVYLEWPPLNRDYIHNPYFLTLDNQGNLRVHHVKEYKEKLVEKGEELFHCATFSLDGKYIYAINNQQELCKIDFSASKIVMRRRIEGLSSSDPQGTISSNIKQLTPWIFAIGSVMKTGAYLHVVCGDISDLNEELKIKIFEIPMTDSTQNVVFRSLYVKERQLLLFSHTRSNRVLALYFGFDGSIQEIPGLFLANGLLRGIVLVKEESPSKIRTVNSQKKTVKLPVSPQILILDSTSKIFRFNYFDTRFSAPALSMTVCLVWLVKFTEREKFLWKKLIPPKKSRCKSCIIKDFPSMESGKSKRNQSLSFDKKSQYNLWKKEIRVNGQLRTIRKSKVAASSQKTDQKPSFTNLFKPSESIKPTNLFTSQNKPIFIAQNKKTEITKTENKSTNFAGLFKSQAKETENKPTNNPFLSTNNLFTSEKTSTTSTSTSLFGSANSSSSKPNCLFDKKTSEIEGLFSQVSNKSTGLDASSLFSSSAPPKTFLKVFTTPEDPLKKKAFLFLNKLESDVLFKVENEEFPAHKYILSEKCKFFKNMFESGMLESHSSVIHVPEIKASVFKAFLEYVYKGQTLFTEDIALNLIDLSERYIIHEMKLACENFLQNVLSLDNCLNFLEMAYLYDAALLKKWTLFFFQISLKKIMERIKDIKALPKMSYLQIQRLQWNENVILGPPLSDLIFLSSEEFDDA